VNNRVLSVKIATCLRNYKMDCWLAIEQHTISSLRLVFYTQSWSLLCRTAENFTFLGLLVVYFLQRDRTFFSVQFSADTADSVISLTN